MKNIVDLFKKFWDFLKKDNLPSLMVFLVLIFMFLLLIFFPLLRYFTGTQYPLVIVESCSMHHDEYGFNNTFTSSIYEKNHISINDTSSWDFPMGVNKGDIIFIIGTKNINVGDVIIFNGGENHPIIHRIIDDIEPYQTKGDNHITNYEQLSVEKNISNNQILGKAIFRIPYLGWIKLIFFDWMKSDGQRGFC
jgi:hypothetical protein